MFSSGPNYTKLKTNLRLALNRLKLIEKKKTELTQKARKEIADYLIAGKPERAKIRVEHIIREDYMVEAMEVVEMYCDLLLARYGLITQMNQLDDGIAEAVYSLVWVAPRMQTDIQELKVISDLLITKYGKQFEMEARTATGEHKVSEKLMHKMAIQAPPKLLVEKYLIEIAKIYNVDYEPDPQVMRDDSRPIGIDNFLIDLSDKNNLGGGGLPPAPQMGFVGYPQPPQLPVLPSVPFSYPNSKPGGGSGGSGGASAPPFAYNIPPNPMVGEQKDCNLNQTFLKEEGNNQPPAYSSISPDDNLQIRPTPYTPRLPSYSSLMNNNNMQYQEKPKPQPRSKIPPEMSGGESTFNLPNVPSGMPDPDEGAVGGGSTKPADDEIDFDDLSRRFEELKKIK